MSGAGRPLRAAVVVDAPADRVWTVLTDFGNLVDASPELVAMTPLKRGGLRPGQWYLGWNRRKGVVWPTRNVITRLEPSAALVWDTTTSGARWIFELEPRGEQTLLTQRRETPRRVTLVGRIFAATLLGGRASHDDELDDALGATLAHLKAVAERR